MHETKAIENKIAIAQLYKSGATGLDISYQIVTKKHKGKLWCTSEPGERTEFWLEIPLNQRVI
jgi:hypothetical protein